MKDSVRASEWGLALVDHARRSKRWNKTAELWCQAAFTSRSTLNRFWAQQFIRTETFASICEAVGVNWQEVTETPTLAIAEDAAGVYAEQPDAPILDSYNRLHQDWGDAPAVDEFYGRVQELALLETWVRQDRCRLVTLQGMGGMGKTALTAKLAQRVWPDFDRLIWRSLRNAPPLDQILLEVIQFLSGQQTIVLPPILNGKIRELIQCLRQSRCLLVLDNLESILASCDRTGRYLDGYEDYGQLIQAIGNTDHQSCLILTTREKPTGLNVLEGQTLPSRNLQIGGLTDLDAQSLFAAKGQFTASDTDWPILMSRYSGNPLALKIVGSAVRDYFEGNVSEFLTFIEGGLFIFDDIRDLLERQFQRLTPLEQEIMYWLALRRVPVSVADLKQDFVALVAINDLIQALASLKRRSLIEKLDAGFTQQPVVMEYVTHVFLQRVSAEICQQDVQLLRSHALLQVHSPDYIQRAQRSLILQPLANQLLETLGSAPEISAYSQQILTHLRGQPCLATGYVAGNLINLLHYLKVNLSQFDFSALTIWQADLQRVNLHQVNLADADLQGSVFTELLGNVLAAAFSPDGQWLATGDTDSKVRLWSVASGQLLGIGQGHRYWVRALAFAPSSLDNQAQPLLASAGADCTIKLWRLHPSVQCQQTLTGHSKEIFALAIHPTGLVLASASGDHTLKLWHLETGECLATCAGHSAGIRAVAFAPDANVTKMPLLASGSEDHSIKLWQGQTGDYLQTLTGHQGWVRALAFSADGTLLASGSDDGTIRLWDLKTSTCIQLYTGHEGGVYTLAFSPQGLVLASGSGDHTVKLWDCSVDQCLRTVQGHGNQIFLVTFHPEGHMLACVALDQTVRLWDWRTGQCLRNWQGHTDWTFPVAWHPQGKVVASGSGDHLVRIWDWQQQRCLQTLTDHRDLVTSLVFSADGRYLVSGSNDNAIKIWEWQAGRCLRTLWEHSDWVFSVAQTAADPDQPALLASAGADLEIRLWELATGRCVRVLTGHTDHIWCLDFSPDGCWLVSSSTDLTIRLWELATGDCVRVFRGHCDRIYSIAFSPDGQQLASAAQDGTVRLWDIETGDCSRILIDQEDWMMAVAYSPDGTRLATGAYDASIKLWDRTTGECLKTLPGHTHLIYNVAFSPDGQWLASGSQDQSLRVWEVTTGDCVAVLAARLYEGMNIRGVQGLTEAQRLTLKTLGAVD